MLFLLWEYKLHEGRELAEFICISPEWCLVLLNICIHVWMNSVYHSFQVYLLICCLTSPVNLGVSGKQELDPFIQHSSQILAWCLATEQQYSWCGTSVTAHTSIALWQSAAVIHCESMNTKNFACVLLLSLWSTSLCVISFDFHNHIDRTVISLHKNTKCRDV